MTFIGSKNIMSMVLVENDYHLRIWKGAAMTLFESEKQKEYMITGLFVEEAVTRRLQALGLNDGTKIKVYNRKKGGALIIKVRGTRLALGKHLSSNIEVQEINLQ